MTMLADLLQDGDMASSLPEAARPMFKLMIDLLAELSLSTHGLTLSRHRLMQRASLRTIITAARLFAAALVKPFLELRK